MEEEARHREPLLLPKGELLVPLHDLRGGAPSTGPFSSTKKKRNTLNGVVDCSQLDEIGLLEIHSDFTHDSL